MSRKFDLGNPVEPRQRRRFRQQYGDMPRRSKSHTVSATADYRRIFATPTRMVLAGPSESLPAAQISRTPSAKLTNPPDDRSVQSTEPPGIRQTLSVESLPTRKGGVAVVPSDVHQGSSLGRSDCVTLISDPDMPVDLGLATRP